MFYHSLSINLIIVLFFILFFLDKNTFTHSSKFDLKFFFKLIESFKSILKIVTNQNCLTNSSMFAKHSKILGNSVSFYKQMLLKITQKLSQTYLKVTKRVLKNGKFSIDQSNDQSLLALGPKFLMPRSFRLSVGSSISVRH